MAAQIQGGFGQGMIGAPIDFSNMFAGLMPGAGQQPATPITNLAQLAQQQAEQAAADAQNASKSSQAAAKQSSASASGGSGASKSADSGTTQLASNGPDLGDHIASIMKGLGGSPAADAEGMGNIISSVLSMFA